jgi:hypothetical protein
VVAEADHAGQVPHVARHVEVEPAVAVDVGEARARAPAAVGHARLFRHVTEPPVHVAVEGEGAIAGNQEVRPVVAVDVRRRAPHPDALLPETGPGGHVLEAERPALRRHVAEEGAAVGADEKDVEAAVAVGVEESGAVPQRLQDVEWRAPGVAEGEAHARLPRDVAEEGRGSGPGSGAFRPGTAGRPEAGEQESGGKGSDQRILAPDRESGRGRTPPAEPEGEFDVALSDRLDGKGGDTMASQEVSKPVLITVIVAAVLIIGFIGWYFFLRSPASTAGTGVGAPPGMGGQGAPGYPGAAPGGPPGPPGAAPGGPPGPPGAAPAPR